MEVRNRQDVSDFFSTVRNLDVGRVTARVFAKHQKHAKRGTIHVLRLRHIDHVLTTTPIDLFVGFTEVLMGAEVKTPADIDGDVLAVTGDIYADGI